VQVRTRGASRGADHTDHLAALHRVTRFHEELGCMAVACLIAVAMIDQDHQAVSAGIPTRFLDHAIGGGVDRIGVVAIDVHAGVLPAVILVDDMQVARPEEFRRGIRGRRGRSGRMRARNVGRWRGRSRRGVVVRGSRGHRTAYRSGRRAARYHQFVTRIELVAGFQMIESQDVIQVGIIGIGDFLKRVALGHRMQNARYRRDFQGETGFDDRSGSQIVGVQHGPDGYAETAGDHADHVTRLDGVVFGFRAFDLDIRGGGRGGLIRSGEQRDVAGDGQISRDVIGGVVVVDAAAARNGFLAKVVRVFLGQFGTRIFLDFGILTVRHQGIEDTALAGIQGGRFMRLELGNDGRETQGREDAVQDVAVGEYQEDESARRQGQAPHAQTQHDEQSIGREQ